MPVTHSDLFKKIRRIQIQTSHLVENIFAGAYKSAFKGKGIEFEEVKEYQPGDDVRNIDWNVTARMGHPYIKNFREERELTVMLIVDASSSSRFGGTHGSKHELIAEIGALFAFSAIKNNDKVGLLLFSDKVDSYLIPNKGTRHVLRIVRELLLTPTINKSTDLAQAMTFIGTVQSRRAICIILSDFICPDFTHELELLARKHDVIAISITDPYEERFPDMQLVELQDLETGESQIVDSSYPPTQLHVYETHKKRMQEVKTLMQNSGASFLEILTDTPYLETLKKFFKLRGQRLK